MLTKDISAGLLYVLVIRLLCWQYTLQDLLERIQASEEEIKSHLETIHACQIDGKCFRYYSCMCTC